MAIVTTSVNLSSLTLVEGELVDIRNGAVLTIDSSTGPIRPGQIQCLTTGECFITNASTTVPLVLALSDQNRDLRFEGNAKLRVRGNYMSLGAGTGAAQSFNFATLFGGVLTSVTLVEIESAPGSGNWYPWHIVDITPRFYNVNRNNDRSAVVTEFDGIQPVLFWNADTRLLTSGAGNGVNSASGNGRAIPAGCGIRIPNILITQRDTDYDAMLVHTLLGENAPSGGTFTITTFNARTGANLGTTAPIAFNATAATVQAALQAVVGAGNVIVTSGPLPSATGLSAAGAFSTTPLRFLVDSTLITPSTSVYYTRDNNPGTMCLLDITPAGTADIEVCMFSAKFRHAHTSFTRLRMVGVGISGDAPNISSSNGSVELDRVHYFHNPYAPAAQPLMSVINGATSFNKVVVTTSRTESAFNLQLLPGCTRMDDIAVLQYGRRLSSNAVSMQFNNLQCLVDINRPRAVGGQLRFANLFGNIITNASQADNPTGTQFTASPVNAVAFLGCQGGTLLRGLTKAGGSASRNFVLTVDSNSANVFVNGVDYDCSLNGTGINPNHVGSVFRNINIPNQRPSGAFDLPGSFTSRIATVEKYFLVGSGSTDFVFDAGDTMYYDMVTATPAAFNESHAGVENFVGGNFTDPGVPPTTGHVTFGAFGVGQGMELFGGAFTDQLGSLFLPSAGSRAVTTIPFVMHGITGFQNVEDSFIAESEGGSSPVWRIINDGVVTGGTFTLTVLDENGVLLGTTSPQGFNQVVANLDAAIEAVSPVLAGQISVIGSLGGGYTVTRSGNQRMTIIANGAALTGGSKPGVCNALGRHNVGVAGAGVLLAGTTVGGITIEVSMRLPGGVWSAWTLLTTPNVQAQFAALTGYTPQIGLEMRLQYTAGANADDYRRVQQVTIPTTVNPALWQLFDASVTIQGPAPTDTVRIRRVSDNAILYTFTGSGLKEFDVGVNFRTEVYYERLDSGGNLLMQSRPTTYRLAFGTNGVVPLFYGAGIQLAQAGTLATIDALLQARLDATISSRLPAAAPDVNLTRIRGFPLTGNGTPANEFGV